MRGLCEKTILALIVSGDHPEALSSTLIAPRVFGGRPGDRDHAIAVHEAHVAEVQTTVPADRLLIHHLGDGWGPLCDHLGVSVPAAPCPRSNSTEAFQTRNR